MDSDIRQLIWDRAKKYYPVKASHGLNHIEDNLNMAEKMLAFAKEPFTDQIYAAIVFHDSGLEKYGREIHEVHSAEIAKRELKDLFNSKDLFLIAAAIREHRASFKGTFTSMLSDICSSADRNAPNFEASIARSFLYTNEHHPEFSFEEKCETVAKHQHGKYGTKGYARFPIYYSRYYGKDLREYQRKMDALTGDVVARVVGSNGKNASKLYDASMEGYSETASEISGVYNRWIGEYMYHGSSSKFTTLEPQIRNNRTTSTTKPKIFFTPFKGFAGFFCIDQNNELLSVFGSDYDKESIVVLPKEMPVKDKDGNYDLSQFQQVDTNIAFKHNVKEFKSKFTKRFVGYIHFVKTDKLISSGLQEHVFHGMPEYWYYKSVRVDKVERVEITATFEYDSQLSNKVGDAALESLSDKVASNPKEFVDEKKLEMKELPTNPSDKELQLLLNSSNEAAKASNDDLWTLQDLKNKFKQPIRKLCHFFLFYYDDKPIGGAMYMDPDDQCRAFSIGDFAIYKEYRGKGFGSKCFKMLLDKIKKSNGTLPIYLGVYVNNTKAIALYKKFGFKIAKTMEENSNKFHQMFLGKPIELKSDKKQSGATESLSDKVASNIVNDKVYHASPKKFDVISGKKSNTPNAKSSVFVSPFKHFASMFILDFQGIVDQIEEQIGKKHIKIDNFGFMEWNETPRSTTSIPSKVHVLVRTPENFKPFKGKATGYMYTIDFSKYKDQANMWSKAKDSDVEFTIHGDVKPEKCEQISYEYEVLKDTKQYNHAEESMEEFASETMQDTVSAKKMYFANNDGKLPKDANGNIVLTKNITDATIYAAFDQFNDSKVAMACKGFVQYKNGTNKHVLVVHGDDSLTEPEELDCVGTIYSVTLSEPIEFRYHGHRGFGKCQLPKVYTVREEALKDAKIEKVDTVSFKATFEYEKSLTMQHVPEVFSTEDFEPDIAIEIISEINAGIEEFKQWIRQHELSVAYESIDDAQTKQVIYSLAQENILVRTVKEIFRKIAQFIGWFFRKLKELWNFFFGRMQRKIRMYNSMRDTLKKYIASNVFFNEKAFRDLKAPTGMAISDEVMAMMEEAYVPDKLYDIFKEIYDLWEKDPLKLHEIMTVELVNQGAQHRFYPLRHTGYGNGVGKGVDDIIMKYFPAKGTMLEAGFTCLADVDEYCKYIDVALKAYYSISKIFSSHGDIMAQAQRRMLEYADRTDITEKEAAEMANKVQGLSGILKNITSIYIKSFEFILDQGIMSMNVAFKYVKK